MFLIERNSTDKILKDDWMIRSGTHAQKGLLENQDQMGKNDPFHHRVGGRSSQGHCGGQGWHVGADDHYGFSQPSDFGTPGNQRYSHPRYWSTAKDPEMSPCETSCFPHTGRAKNKNILPLVNYNDLAWMTSRDKCPLSEIKFC